MIGTRGVPARYGGFETAVEEVGSRLVTMGHEVVVYCRGRDRSDSYLGMSRVRLPSLRHPVMETLSHTALSVGHLFTHRTDVAIVFNAANAPLLPAIKAARIPVAVHVDGLEWQRAKWGPVGRRYYLANERLAVRWADELISDAVGIQDYYRERYGAESTFLAYGAPIIPAADAARLAELDLVPGGYHLAVARMEPENHVDVIVQGYRASAATLPLVVVGSVPYPSTHEQTVQTLAAEDHRIRMLGGVWDQDLLNSLYAGAASYVHGHSVGGTNPSLLRAMGAGAPTLAWEVNFNREVLGDTGRFFATGAALSELLESTEADQAAAHDRGEAGRLRAMELYRWDTVAVGYEKLCLDLQARGLTRRRLTLRGRSTRLRKKTAGSALNERAVSSATERALKERPLTERTLTDRELTELAVTEHAKPISRSPRQSGSAEIR
jgi:glycosyltransferase involved in cell wall biosynthesis